MALPFLIAAGVGLGQVGTSIYGRYRAGQQADEQEALAHEELQLQKKSQQQQADFARRGLAVQNEELNARWRGAQSHFQDTLSQLRRARGQEEASHAAGGIRGGTMHSETETRFNEDRSGIERELMQEAQIHSSGVQRLRIGREEIESQRYFQDRFGELNLTQLSSEFDNMKQQMNMSMWSNIIGATGTFAHRAHEAGFPFGGGDK